MRLIASILLLAACALAQDADDLQKQLDAERKRGEARDQRIAELERALEKATEAMARSQDRRGLEKEIEDYLDAQAPASLPATQRESRLQIGGVIVGSFRYADFTGSEPSRNTFQLDDVFLRFVYRFSETTTARYYTDGSLAELEYAPFDVLQFNVGVIVIPFGQFNQRSFPDTFDTISRPYLYLGDEEIFSIPENNPRPVFQSLYSDTGFVVSGSKWWKSLDQFYYAVSVANGLTGVDDLGTGSGFRDNNRNKQVGARLAYTNGSWLERTRVGFGLSWATGKYDSNDSLSYRLYGAELLVVFDELFQGDGSLTLRAEYVYAPRETNFATVDDPSTRVNDRKRVQGAYLIAELRLDRAWMVYGMFDWMSQKAPLTENGLVDLDNLDDVTVDAYRYALGVAYRFKIGVLWKAEYAYYGFGAGASDVHAAATQFVVPF
ncbi:MAG: hypothetical protein ACYTGZ_09650 [Planctomycetota bacterium]|jgi:hypothetical protein